MTQQDYEQKKHACWGEFKRENLDGEVQWQPVRRYEIFSAAFDRAYALGKKFGNSESSDAEGEEMLCCDKSVVQDMAKSAIRSIQIHNYLGNTIASQNMVTFNRGIKFAIVTLFGYKCMPDNAESSAHNIESSEPNVDSSAPNVDSSAPNVDSLPLSLKS